MSGLAKYSTRPTFNPSHLARHGARNARIGFAAALALVVRFSCPEPRRVVRPEPLARADPPHPGTARLAPGAALEHGRGAGRLHHTCAACVLAKSWPRRRHTAQHDRYPYDRGLQDCLHQFNSPRANALARSREPHQALLLTSDQARIWPELTSFDSPCAGHAAGATNS